MTVHCVSKILEYMQAGLFEDKKTASVQCQNLAGEAEMAGALGKADPLNVDCR
jgi:hypothetical protein